MKDDTGDAPSLPPPPAPPLPPERASAWPRRAWAKFRALPVWVQILAGFLAVGVVVGPFTEEDEAESESTTAERSTTTEGRTAATEERTTTTGRGTTTAEATTPATLPATSQPTSTTTEAGTRTPGPTPSEFDDPVAQQAYDIERGICADYTPEEVAAEAPVTPRSMSPADVADANSKGYQPHYQAAALLGCLAGFRDQGLLFGP